MLQVNPINRLSCDDLLKNSMIIKRMEILNCSNSVTHSNLLNTIKLPRNINDINDRLPKKTNYDSDKKKDDRKFNTLNSSKEIVNNILEEFLYKKSLHTLEDLPSNNSLKMNSSSTKEEKRPISSDKLKVNNNVNSKNSVNSKLNIFN